jgi:hypothetical protein
MGYLLSNSAKHQTMSIPFLASSRRPFRLVTALFMSATICSFSGGTDSQNSPSGDTIVTILHNGKPVADLSDSGARRSLKILRASYGPLNDPGHTLDATDAVRQLVAEGRTEIPVAEITRRIGDPQFGVVKTLTIEFSRDETSRTVTAQDSGTATLSEPKSAAAPAEIALNFDSAAPGLLLRTPGSYELRTSADKRLTTAPSTFSTPVELDGAWTLQFPGKKEITLPSLTSWHTSTDDSIKYFSGTAIYRKTFRIPQNFSAQRVELDLGEVREIAEVSLNGRSLGVLWKQVKTLDITDAYIHNPDAENVLEIRVTNLWPNRLIGDQHIPAPDEARNPNGTLKRWPQWLLDGKKDPSGRESFSMRNLWSKTDAPLPSGLLGPVRLKTIVPVATRPATGNPTLAPLATAFAKPAPEYRPWVYWFWNNGNLTKEGVTADLEAMAAVGIGGVLIMDVGQDAPRGPVGFMDEKWREIFRLVISESKRLGIEVNMNNDAGWNGSGGAWITPAESMQTLSWTETTFTAPATAKVVLPKPKSTLNYYRDIVVLAFPTPQNTGPRAIPNADQPRPTNKTVNNPVIAHKDIIILSGRLAADGTLDWQPPAPGKWTLLRIGHTSKNWRVAPAPEGAEGLECDKLSVAASVSAFEGQIGKLVAENKEATGKVFVSTHIDSWENGSQTWTPLMREEFQQRRKYDVLAYLPVFAGYQIDSSAVTEDFLWDFRRTVSEMVLDNHVSTFRKLSHERGLRLSIEAYGAPCDSLQFAGMADEPMGEFWTAGSWVGVEGWCLDSCRGMASAGHVYGHNIIGAETFTATEAERWTRHPGTLKATGDRAFAEGINRFVFHRYSFQPWKDVKPGLMMGPWGQHYERTQTWWHLTPAWHEYLARCQFMLRQGRFVADIAYIEPEDSPQSYTTHPKNGYSWDQCGTDAVLKMSVSADGKIVLPSGASYEVLVLPKSERMTSVLLQKVHALVRDGATVIGGEPPKRVPGLAAYREEESAASSGFKASLLALWGEAPAPKGGRDIGKGRFIWGETPVTVLTTKGFPRDFVATHPLRQIHRRTADGDIYFVANGAKVSVLSQGTFRATGRPEIWHPETGKRIVAPVYRSAGDGTTTVLLPFAPTESYFVVFPK